MTTTTTCPACGAPTAGAFCGRCGARTVDRESLETPDQAATQVSPQAAPLDSEATHLAPGIAHPIAPHLATPHPVTPHPVTPHPITPPPVTPQPPMGYHPAVTPMAPAAVDYGTPGWNAYGAVVYPSAPPEPRRSPLVPALAAGLVAVLLGGAGIWFVTQSRNDPDPSAATDASDAAQASDAPTPDAPSADRAAAPAPTQVPAVPAPAQPYDLGAGRAPDAPDAGAPANRPSGAPDRSGQEDLMRKRQHDSSSIRFGGRRVAMLASKWDGIVDPQQRAANGTRTFYYSDILAEHEDLGRRVGTVRLALASDLFSQPGSRETWVTFYDGAFSSDAAVRSWCAKTFPGLSGNALNNQCTPKQLTARP